MILDGIGRDCLHAVPFDGGGDGQRIGRHVIESVERDGKRRLADRYVLHFVKIVVINGIDLIKNIFLLCTCGSCHTLLQWTAEYANGAFAA